MFKFSLLDIVINTKEDWFFSLFEFSLMGRSLLLIQSDEDGLYLSIFWTGVKKVYRRKGF